MAVVTPTDRPKSVHNRCAIDVLRFCVVTLLFGFFCGCRGFCHRTESDLFLFLFTSQSTLFQLFMWWHIYVDVQANWSKSWSYVELPRHILFVWFINVLAQAPTRAHWTEFDKNWQVKRYQSSPQDFCFQIDKSIKMANLTFDCLKYFRNRCYEFGKFDRDKY